MREILAHFIFIRKCLHHLNERNTGTFHLHQGTPHLHHFKLMREILALFIFILKQKPPPSATPRHDEANVVCVRYLPEFAFGTVSLALVAPPCETPVPSDSLFFLPWRPCTCQAETLTTVQVNGTRTDLVLIAFIP